MEIVERWGNERFDAIITFAYPFSAHLLGMKLKQRFGTRWIAHFSDPWAGNPYNKYGPISEKINAGMERDAIGKADMSIFVSQEFRELYAKRYPGHAGKFAVLEHSYDPALYPSRYKPNERLTLRYVGHFYGARSPEPLFRALRQLREEGGISEKDFLFEMVGSGMRVPFLIRKYGLEAIAVQKPPVGYSQSLGLMQESDALMVIDADVSGESVFLPSKLIEYVGSGRPVLGITPKGSASERAIKEANGLVAQPGDAQGITDMVRALVRMRKAGKLDGMKPPSDILKKYSIKSKIGEFTRLLDSAARRE